MKKENYYALVNYRGKEKYYHIVASNEEDKDGYDTRIEYLDYNLNREWDGVWIKNGKEKIIEKFDKNTKVYKYFKNLYKNWDKFIEQEIRLMQKIYKTDDRFGLIGTDHYKKCFKKAIKETPNPLNINL